MRFDLPADAIPTAWFNVAPVMPEPLQPPLHPGTKEPIGPDDLAPLFPMGLIAQEVTAEPWVDIPGEVLDILRLWRPTPLVRAERLERALGTPARIYFKDESVSPAGSHKEPGTGRPASTSFSTKCGSLLTLKVRTRWGFRPFACHTRWTIDRLTPNASASVRVLQWVAAGGVVCVVASTIR